MCKWHKVPDMTGTKQIQDGIFFSTWCLILLVNLSSVLKYYSGCGVVPSFCLPKQKRRRKRVISLLEQWHRTKESTFQLLFLGRTLSSQCSLQAALLWHYSRQGRKSPHKLLLVSSVNLVLRSCSDQNRKKYTMKLSLINEGITLLFPFVLFGRSKASIKL